MTKRVITGVFFTLLILAGIWFEGWVMLALLGFAMLVSTHEIFSAFSHAGAVPVKWTSYLFCALAVADQALCMYASRSSAILPALLLCVLLALANMVLRGRIAVENLLISVLPMVYPGIFYVVLMRLLSLPNRAVVITALLLAFFSASINDVFALFSGMFFGKHKLSPELSPKKTIEGSVGGMIFCIAFSVAVPVLLRLVFQNDAAFIAGLESLPPLWSFGLLGLVAGAFSQIGDLTASMIKRHCGVKDYGKLLPGHGGIMDRLDGVLFCGAVCYIFFQIAGLIS